MYSNLNIPRPSPTELWVGQSLVVVLNNKGRTRIVCIEKPSRATKKDFGSSKKGSRSFSHVYIYELGRKHIGKDLIVQH